MYLVNFLSKLSFFAVLALLLIHVKAESAYQLQLNPIFENCKSNIESNYSALQDFSKSFDFAAMSQRASLFSKEGRENIHRLPTWKLMKSMGASPSSYTEKINSWWESQNIIYFMKSFNWI